MPRTCRPSPPFLRLPSTRRTGRAGATASTPRYYASAGFDGVPHRPRELTYPSSGKMVGDVPANPRPLFTRIDPQVNFRWWDGAPRPGMNDDDFGVRWTGYLAVPATGKYQIGAIGMNAFELYLDGKRIADLNNIHERNYRYADLDLKAGKFYALRLDYHEFVGDADIQLVWSHPDPGELDDAVRTARRADAVVLVLGLSAAPRRRGDERSGRGLRGRRPHLSRAAARAGRPDAGRARYRQANRAGPAEWQRGGGQPSEAAGSGNRRGMVPGPGRGRRDCGRAVRRLQPCRPPAGHLLPFGGPTSAVYRLRNERPDVPLFHGRAAVPLRIRAELYDFRVSQALAGFGRESRRTGARHGAG